MAAGIANEHQHASAALAASHQELALMQQRLEVAEKQMELLRAQLADAEGGRAKTDAEQRRLQVEFVGLSAPLSLGLCCCCGNMV